MTQEEIVSFLISNNLITNDDLHTLKISVNNRDLECIDILNIYKIRMRIAKDDKLLAFMKILIENLSKSTEDTKLRIIKLKGSKNMILYADSGLTKIFGVLDY